MSRALAPTLRAALLVLALAMTTTLAVGAGPAVPTAAADHCVANAPHDEDGDCPGQSPICNNVQDADPVANKCMPQPPCAPGQADTEATPCLTTDEARCRPTPGAHAWPCPVPQTQKCANYYAYQTTWSEHCDPATVRVYSTGTYVSQPTPDRDSTVEALCSGYRPYYKVCNTAVPGA